MTKEEAVCSIFYQLNKLKDEKKRKGWHDKGIKRNRVESVADHIFGCQMLAYAMYSEFDYDVDIDKVILMIAIHEIGETIIGDLTPFDMPRSEKKKIEREAVLKLVSMIPNGDFIKEIYLEMEEGKTKEADFVYQVDHAECDLQAKLYVQEGCFAHKYSNEEMINSFISFDRGRIAYDKNFDTLLEYVKENDMLVKEHQDNPFQNVVSFYTITNTLKDKKRVGEEIWKVNKEHYGSVAEHVYSVQMLGLLIYLVYEENLNIKKAISLISTHDLGEIITGDVSTLLKTEKNCEDEYVAARQITSILTKGDKLLEQIKEYNSEKTKEAIFAKYCDKLTPDIISKIYDQQKLVDLNNQDENIVLNNEIVRRLLDEGATFSEMWILYGQEVYRYPEPFISISTHALTKTLAAPKM